MKKLRDLAELWLFGFLFADVAVIVWFLILLAFEQP